MIRPINKRLDLITTRYRLRKEDWSRQSDSFYIVLVRYDGIWAIITWNHTVHWQ